MQTIANAVQAYKVRTRAPAYPNIADVSTQVGSAGQLSDLQFAPQCPSDPANKYSVATDANGGFVVTCTNAAHGKWQDGAIIQAP